MRSISICLVTLLLLHCVTPCFAASENEKLADFVDKWVISGNAIGNALGAVAGQALFSVLFGPAGWAIGSMVGGFAGGLIGEYMDNKIHKSYNYSAFNRPALGEPGSIVLENAGPYEQLFYQIDSRVIVGGNITAFISHMGLNCMARAVPGCGFLGKPLLLFTADYLAGILGDNVDGLMDFSSVGAELDAIHEAKEPTISSPSRPFRRSATIDELYLATVRAIESSSNGPALEDVKCKWEEYKAATDKK